MSDRVSTPYGTYEVTAVPAQPQVAHCHGFFVLPEARGQGKALELKRDQMEYLREHHYDYATATVDASNHYMKTVMEKAGWEFLTSFRNRKTGGWTELWGCYVTAEAMPEGS